MSKRVLKVGTLAILVGSTLCAQGLVGDWQGTLEVGAQKLRSVLHITKAENGGWDARFISVDQGDMGGIAVDSLTVQGSNLKFKIEMIRGSYTGTISGDGNSIAGTWTQGKPLPLEFRRATKDTLWKDPSPHTVQIVIADNDVKLEVLDWGGSGRPVVLLAGWEIRLTRLISSRRNLPHSTTFMESRDADLAHPPPQRPLRQTTLLTDWVTTCWPSALLSN